MNKQSLGYSLLVTLLQVALLVTLFVGVRQLYDSMPSGAIVNGESVGGETALQIILRPSARDNGVAIDVPVQLYPVDVSAVQREFGFEPHPGVHFEDFLKERMQGRSPVRARFDRNGRATVIVSQGKWWVHAMLAGSQNVEWRLPITVTGRQQQVELNADNAYARTKTF